MAIRILHLSDLHLVKETEENKTISVLIEDLISSIDQIGKESKINLVIFTGDLIDKGGANFDSIKDAFAEFENLVTRPILTKLNLSKEHFVFVPGNHDTINKRPEQMYKMGLLGNTPHDDYEKVVKMKNSSQDYDYLRSRTAAFKEYERTYYTDVLGDNYQYGDFESNYKLEIDGYKIGITSLNSVWLCGLDDDKEFYLGADQIVNSHHYISDCDIKIAATHIAYDLLTDAEKDHIKEIIADNYNLCLSGHTHTITDGYIALPSGNCCMNITSAGTLCDNVYAKDDRYKNSFQVIDMLSIDEFIIRKYRQINGMSFKLDTTFGDNGIWHYPENKDRAKANAMAESVKDKNDEQKKLLDAIYPFRPIDLAIENDKKTFFCGEFIATKRNTECISELKNNKNKNIRLLALSGIGKTRIVGEAFKGQTNVYYSKISDNLLSGLNYILENYDNGIIIVDDCPIDRYYQVIKLISSYQKSFRLISIYNVLTKEEIGIGTNEFFIDASENEDVVDIIIDREDIDNEEVKSKIKEYSDGIPLMTIELIDAYKHLGIVKLLPEKQQWLDYLLHPEGKLDSNKRAVLNTIAAFNPLGYKDAKRDELDFIIDHPEFHHIHFEKDVIRDCFLCSIEEFYRRRLLDIRANSVNLRPRPLAEWLAEEWIQKTPHIEWSRIISAFENSGQLGERLADQMKNRFKSLSSPEAKKLFDELNNIPFHDEKIVITKTGSQLIFSMSTVSQVAVANNLFSLFKDKEATFFQEKIVDDVRRNIVWALEEACVNEEAFVQACELLGLLAIAENESVSNNATGVFLEKFHIVLSGTQAGVKEKIEVMRYLFDRGRLYYSLLAKAVNHAFETRSNYRMLTNTERKYGIRPNVSIKIADLRLYWSFCKDLLIKMGDDKAVLNEVYKLVPNHIYDFINNNCEDVLFELIDYFAPRYNYDWDDMRRFLNMIKCYNKEAYERNKQQIDHLVSNVFAPKTFKKRIIAAMENIDRRNVPSEQIFDVYKSEMRPYGEEFIREKIYNRKEFEQLADEPSFQSIWMIFSALEFMEEHGCRDEVYSSFISHISSKPKDYRSGFIESYMSHDPNKSYLSTIANKLIEEEYYAMGCSLLGMVDNADYWQLNRIFRMIHEGKFPSEYINNYTQFITYNTIDDIFNVSDLLFDNEDVDKVEVAYHHLFQHLWSIDHEQFVPYLPKVEKRLLEYDFNNDNSYFARDVVNKMADILKTYDRPDFAKQVNSLIIEHLKAYRTYGMNPFENIYFSLLPKYQDIILDDVINALASPLDQNMFYLNIDHELGSGFGYGSGPLFQCDNDKLKKACEMYPETLPERFANMCPVCNYNEGQMELSDFFRWLADNFGNDEKVLQSFSSNFGTYSYTGVGSMKNYYINRQNMFKPLFTHANPKVASWAKSMYELENREVNYQQMVDDYRDMIED